MKIALCGNPNVGKSSIFNFITKGKQEIGNWPGKTIEKKWGYTKVNGKRIEIVDLPGIYGLGAISTEEKIAKKFLIKEKPEAIIDIIDATNIERNLYLTTQLLEMGLPVIIALNKIDAARKQGMKIDKGLMERILGARIVETIGNKGKGIERLLKEAISIKKAKPLKIDYGEKIEKRIAQVESIIKEKWKKRKQEIPLRYCALSALMGDEEIMEILEKEEKNKIEEIAKKFKEEESEDIDVAIADVRYGWIHGLVKKAVDIPIKKEDFSDILDKVLTHQVFGVLFFLGVIFLTYQIIFIVSEPIVNLLEEGISYLGTSINIFLESYNFPNWLNSLLIDGIIAGIGNILVFLPNIFLLFVAMSILEDSGYMARVAFIMDRIMKKVGLHGKAFIPLVLAFGCNVPAIMAARTMEEEKDKVATILSSTFIPCSARMVVLVMLTGAFFKPMIAGVVLWGIVILSISTALFSAWFFKKFLLANKESPFVIELPPYQKPSMRVIINHSWWRTKEFLTKAGTFIFAFSVILWFISTYPNPEKSFIMMMGKGIEPLFRPLGLDWIATVSLIFGLSAKEVVISSMAILLNTGSEGLNYVLPTLWGLKEAIVFMVFLTLYTPCLATVVTIKHETNSWRWAIFSVGYSLAIAYVVAGVVNVLLNILLGY